MTMSKRNHDGRQDKTTQAEEAFRQLLAQVKESQFYGTASLVVKAQNGHIQQVRLSWERIVV